MRVTEVSTLLSRSRRRRTAGPLFDIDALVAGTNGFRLRGSSLALGEITSAAPWSASAGRAEAWSSYTYPPQYSDLNPSAVDVDGHRCAYFAGTNTTGPFTGSLGRYLVAHTQTTKAAWAWPHAAAGCSFAMVLDWPSSSSDVWPYFMTGYSGAEIGVSLFVQNSRFSFVVCNGSGTRIVAPLAPVLTAGVRYLIEGYWSLETGYALRANGGDPTVGAVGEVSGTPSASAPTYNASIGGPFANPYPSTVPTFFAKGRLYDFVMGPGVWSGAEFIGVRRQLAAQFPDIAIDIDGGIDPNLPFAEDESDPRILLP